MSRYLVITLAVALLLGGCASFYGVVETDAAMMNHCTCVGTFAETANPGREDGGFIKHYADTTGVKRRVLERAVQAGATHVVWMHAYSMSAAAQGYHCPEAAPLVVSNAGDDHIRVEDLR